jgi:hypothetical protein
MGYVFSDEEEKKTAESTAKKVLDLSVGDYLLAGRTASKREKEIKEAMEEYGAETKFYKVFRKLHDSAENGNDKDGQLLIDLMDPSFWDIWWTFTDFSDADMEMTTCICCTDVSE